MRSRAIGWAFAGAAATALLCSAAALALVAQPAPKPLMLDLGQIPPSAPSVAAIAEAAPQVVDETPPSSDEPAPPDMDTMLPDLSEVPDMVRAAAVSLPEVEVPVTPDLSLPPKPEKPKVEKRKPEKPVEKKAAKAEPAPEKKPAKEKAADKPNETANPAAASGASAPKTGTKAKGGGAQSPAAYAKAVMKKVRATKKKSGAGKGSVVVGFTIAADGGLAGVKVLQGSGNAALDNVALDHIRRAAPFPPPPEGAGRNYSFEFVGK